MLETILKGKMTESQLKKIVSECRKHYYNHFVLYFYVVDATQKTFIATIHKDATKHELCGFDPQMKRDYSYDCQYINDALAKL